MATANFPSQESHHEGDTEEIQARRNSDQPFENIPKPRFLQNNLFPPRAPLLQNQKGVLDAEMENGVTSNHCRGLSAGSWQSSALSGFPSQPKEQLTKIHSYSVRQNKVSQVLPRGETNAQQHSFSGNRNLFPAPPHQRTAQDQEQHQQPRGGFLSRATIGLKPEKRRSGDGAANNEE